MNIKQKNKTELRDNGVYLIHLLQEFYLKVLPEGLVMEAEKAKNKTRRNSIKKEKESKKVVRKIKRNTIYNL
jgi:hypothetical protein